MTDYPQFGCLGAFKSADFGIPDWVSDFNLDLSANFAFELYGEGEEVPVSNWALFIGIGLIVVFTFVRFRKMA